ncbi:hypothetical protein QCE47_07995 [Caballeronia sp. LZ025]|uniref:hypothetical protein n=1 Tax=Caballeronia TaxID=1827195 RepID=UPI001FD4E74A|nr:MULTISPECIES: hypothetical protein [Caballeronia]MDR5732285.1 hypothetical protein [Caballeronia sp. LZ025]
MDQISAAPDSIESALSLVAKQTANTFRFLKQQRANLLRARAIAEQTRKASMLGSLEHVAAKARLTGLIMNLGCSGIRRAARKSTVD